MRKIASSKSRVIYTSINRNSIDDVKKYGLLSAKAIYEKHPFLLKKIRKGEDELKKWIDRYLKEKDEPHMNGPNAYIHPAPPSVKLPDNHPSKKNDLVQIEIYIDDLLREIPGTKLYGLELEPFRYSEDEWDNLSEEEQDKFLESEDYKKEKEKRERELENDEFADLVKKSPEEIWKHYKPTKESMYAPDVPHLVIMTPNGVIPPKYLNFENIKKASLRKIASIEEDWNVDLEEELINLNSAESLKEKADLIKEYYKRFWWIKGPVAETASYGLGTVSIDDLGAAVYSKEEKEKYINTVYKFFIKNIKHFLYIEKHFQPQMEVGSFGAHTSLFKLKNPKYLLKISTQSVELEYHQKYVPNIIYQVILSGELPIDLWISVQEIIDIDVSDKANKKYIYLNRSIWNFGDYLVDKAQALGTQFSSFEEFLNSNYLDVFLKAGEVQALKKEMLDFFNDKKFYYQDDWLEKFIYETYMIASYGHVDFKADNCGLTRSGYLQWFDY
jgi:hypothetical protein